VAVATASDVLAFGGPAFVGGTIAIIVYAVADFGLLALERVTLDELPILTVGNDMLAPPYAALSISKVLSLIDHSVAIVVLAVARLFYRTLHSVADLLLAILAIVDRVLALTQPTRRHSEVLDFVDLAIAVIVETVTGLCALAHQRVTDLNLTAEAELH